MNATTLINPIRELDYRSNDGIEVRLLWNSATDRVSVRVEDAKLGESFEFRVSAADAHDAFHHPYAYAAQDDGARAVAA